ncbi:MAG TPA: hypothetical protein VH702_01995 [Vicinamibacterales bacterium]|jgi:hypothetical protein
MRYCAGFLILTLLIPSPIAAQSSATADGIRALARGDAAAAARILQPLAEGSEPDPLAQFFLATMYDIGSGVMSNFWRACGLYQKSATRTNPLASQAILLSDVIRRAGPNISALCTKASVKVWREPSPVKFVLGSDHWIATNASGFTIGHGRTERTVPTGWGGLEWEFLPTRYTRLEVTKPAGMVRHFIEFWFWIPNDLDTPTAWSLMWSVYEVTKADAQMVAASDVTYVIGSQPPTTYQVQAVGRLQVNADGDVERAVFGSNAHISVIPYRGAP